MAPSFPLEVQPKESWSSRDKYGQHAAVELDCLAAHLWRLGGAERAGVRAVVALIGIGTAVPAAAVVAVTVTVTVAHVSLLQLLGQAADGTDTDHVLARHHAHDLSDTHYS